MLLKFFFKPKANPFYFPLHYPLFPFTPCTLHSRPLQLLLHLPLKSSYPPFNPFSAPFHFPVNLFYFPLHSPSHLFTLQPLLHPLQPQSHLFLISSYLPFNAFSALFHSPANSFYFPLHSPLHPFTFLLSLTLPSNSSPPSLFKSSYPLSMPPQPIFTPQQTPFITPFIFFAPLHPSTLL